MKTKIAHLMIILAIAAIGLTILPRRKLVATPVASKIYQTSEQIRTLESCVEQCDRLIEIVDPEQAGDLYLTKDRLQSEIKKLKISRVDLGK